MFSLESIDNWLLQVDIYIYGLNGLSRYMYQPYLLYYQNYINFVFYFKINILSKLKPILLSHLYAGKNKEIEIHFLSCLILTYQSKQKYGILDC